MTSPVTRSAAPDLAVELDFARSFAAAAGTRIRQIAADGYRVDTKIDSTIVTTADHEVNRSFIEAVLARFPGDGVLGEEESHPGDGPRTWVIDPVDGTRQFVLGIPVFMVSIALVVDGRAVLGVAHNPSTGETYWATDGGGAFRDGVALRVSTRDGRSAPATVRGIGLHPPTGGIGADALLRVSDGEVRTAPAHGSPLPTVFGGCKVAEGAWEADLYGSTGAHDVAAVCVLVREAGGTVTGRTGAEQRYDRPVDGCVLSNGLFHDALVRAWGQITG